MTHLSIKSLITEMQAGKHLENQIPMAKYMRNKFSFLGIKAVERRKISRHFITALKQHTRQAAKSTENNESPINWVTVYALWELDEREYQLIAMDYLRDVAKYFVSSDIHHLKTLLTTKSWWDTVDNLAKTTGLLVKKFPNHKQTLLKWSICDNLWLRRTAIIHQLGFKEETDTKLLTQVILNNLHSDEFFINKAIGWSLRDYGKYDKAWVQDFIAQHKEALDKLSIREATKHF